MSDTTAQSRPRSTAFTLLRMTAQREATYHGAGGEGPPPADMEMYGALTAALETWRDAGRLRPQALVLIEWLATEHAGYRTQLVGGDQDRFDSWLRAFGDEVSLTQRHPHPAGPTCVELLTVVASAPAGERPEERAARLAVPFLAYLRPGSELEDAREIALSFALWAGQDLAALMQYDSQRIVGYTQARTS
ncbi:hypothetical protein RI578_41770 (plasmid) [Streptomyces sp. BB1-1-1]|uniref:hypothetical protein n=1 Tax=Streptomyces sp. BB1-1-1 TaxID=3074430 RepID=UPI002877C7B6|nr:hypothetical protein [Streptomyces sp. BB1-1-1]WND40821.1 hypothetical protein RI578_41770 [Streptomyces sp. BB1-1-1]